MLRMRPFCEPHKRSGHYSCTLDTPTSRCTGRRTTAMPPPTLSGPLSSTPSSLSLSRLLVVDDEVELLTVLCNMLSERGYEAVGCASGREALARLKEQD